MIYGVLGNGATRGAWFCIRGIDWGYLIFHCPFILIQLDFSRNDGLGVCVGPDRFENGEKLERLSFTSGVRMCGNMDLEGAGGLELLLFDYECPSSGLQAGYLVDGLGLSCNLSSSCPCRESQIRLVVIHADGAGGFHSTRKLHRETIGDLYTAT